MDPSTLTTYPPPGCYDDGVVLPRFQSDIQTGRRSGDYHHDHPHTAADVALRVPVLSRQTPSYRPTFIPALTLLAVVVLLHHFGVNRWLWLTALFTSWHAVEHAYILSV